MIYDEDNDIANYTRLVSQTANVKTALAELRSSVGSHNNLFFMFSKELLPSIVEMEELVRTMDCIIADSNFSFPNHVILSSDIMLMGTTATYASCLHKLVDKYHSFEEILDENHIAIKESPGKSDMVSWALSL